MKVHLKINRKKFNKIPRQFTQFRKCKSNKEVVTIITELSRILLKVFIHNFDLCNKNPCLKVIIIAL